MDGTYALGGQRRTSYAKTGGQGYGGVVCKLSCWSISWYVNVKLLFTLNYEQKKTMFFFRFVGVSIEAVSDSSRYFVIRVLDDSGKFLYETRQWCDIIFFLMSKCVMFFFVCVWISGRSAFLGLGFGDRSDSFDLNVALQDHFKWVKNQEQIELDKSDPKPELDLGFKAGETIKINMKITVSEISALLPLIIWMRLTKDRKTERVFFHAFFKFLNPMRCRLFFRMATFFPGAVTIMKTYY